MRLSVCIPTYNRSEQLRVTLDSFLSQIEEGVEIVISDNASADDTEAMVESYRDSHSSIVYHRWPENMGADRNYLKVVELARGEYCWLFGSDDTVSPGVVGKVLTMLGDRSDIYLFNRLECNFEMKPLKSRQLLAMKEARVFRFDASDVLEGYLEMTRNLGGVFSYLSSIVVRRKAWDAVGYDERFTGSAYSHSSILMTMLRNGCTLHFDPRPLVNARVGDDSFAVHGMARRILLDLNGYGAIRDRIFAGFPGVQLRINQLLQREYPWWVLARRRLLMSNEEWEQVRAALRQIGYSHTRLCLAALLYRFRGLIMLSLWGRRQANRWRIRNGPA
jgi:abequosyltransferase